MMQNPVSDQSFMDMPLLRIADVKTDIRSMFVGFVFQLATELKNILFKFPLELFYVTFISFIAFESIPCRKEILRRNYFFK